MTADGLAGDLPTGAILALCDKVLDEVGRRSHRFSWLRAPGAVADAWLPVEAYYPRHRLVVVCHPERTRYDHLFGQLVPRHGLRLLQFAPGELGADLAMAERVLRRMIARLPDPAGLEPQADEPRARSSPGRSASSREPRRNPPRRTERNRPREPERTRPRERAAPDRSTSRRPTPKLPSISLGRLMARQPRDPLESLRAAREPSLRGTRVRAGRAGVATADHAPEIVVVGVAAGLALAAICGVELIVAVIAVALDSGRVVLGLGIAFDACARALGALDSERAGETGWAWAWAIVGSPTVVAIALGPRSRSRVRSRPRRAGRGETAIEAAPLAILIATLALVFVLIGLLS